MRKEVIELLKNKNLKGAELFNKAFDLYRKSSNHNQRIVQSMNTLGYSSARLESLTYELKKLHAIQERELMKPVEDIVVTDSNELVGSAGAIPPALVPLQDVKNAFADLSNKQQIAESHDDQFDKLYAVFTEANEEVKQEIKLRDEFPFLKEESCPDEFKILVADKLNHYDVYVEARRELFKIISAPTEDNPEGTTAVLDNNQIFEIAKKAVENFVANQDIYKELECFKNTGKILGLHPKLKELKTFKIIEGQSAKQLSMRLSNLVNYINRSTAELKLTTDPDRITLLESKIAGWEREKAYVVETIANKDSAK